MKKNHLITLLVIAGFVGVAVLINRMEPNRVSDQRMEESKQVEEQLDDAAQAEAAAAEQKSEGEKFIEAVEEAAASRPKAYQVEFETSKGTFVVEVEPDWAPIGAKHFREAVEAGVYDQAYFFRVLPDFVVQFGIPGDPEMATVWRNKNIRDEPVKTSNKRGTVTYAMSSAPNSRTTQLFINLADNTQLDGMGFAPFGKVVKGMDVVDKINSEYLQQADQEMIATRGNAYLKQNFPRMDYVKKATVIEPETPDSEDTGAATPDSEASEDA